jgi:hypothetical protein
MQTQAANEQRAVSYLATWSSVVRILRRTDMGVPGFTAEASVYRSETAYAAPLPVAGSQLSGPIGIMPQQRPFPIRRITNRFPPWLTDCLMGCSQNYTACVNNIPNCTSMCESGCIAGCAADCARMPPRQQIDCLAICPDKCSGTCVANCQGACTTAYGDCVDFCYNPRILPQPLPVIG